MTARSVSLSTMFGWIGDTFRLVFRNPGPMLGAGALTIGLFLLLFVPIYGAMVYSMVRGAAGGVPFGGDMTLFWTVYAIAILAGILLAPPILLGWFRLCERVDRGAGGRATDILRPYGDGQAWRRGIGAGLLGALLYLVAVGLVTLAFWSSMSGFVEQVLAQQAATLAGTPVTPQPPPAGFFLAYVCVVVVMCALQVVYLAMFSEIALRPTPVVAALLGALHGVGRNLLKLMLFGLCLILIAFVSVLLFGLVVALVLFVASLLGKVLAFVLAGVLYLALLLLIYPLMFASGYLAWKSLLGDATEPPALDAAVMTA